jgi:tetrapyrrole methylase family protein/MazG family protein
MIEEAYESVEAINNKDDDNLCEELGDVMLQVIFHSSLAEEENKFTLIDVINGECDKMIRRHPHIFADGDAKTVDKVLVKWENIKYKERGSQSVTSRLEDVPSAFPALIRSAKVQKKAADIGFDFTTTEDACGKLNEETQELIEACRNHDEGGIAEEMGDLFFSAVNVSRFLNVEPEGALRSATEKFIKRFSQMERMAQAAGSTLDDMSLDQMNGLWDEVKKQEV